MIFQTFKIHLSGFILLFLLAGNTLWAQPSKYNLSRQDSARISALRIKAEQYRDKKQLKQESECFNDMAMIYWEHNYFDEAVENYQKSLAINKQLANENGIAMINSNLALIMSDKGANEQALSYFKETLKIRKLNKEKVGTISAHINIAVILNSLKRFQEAESHLLDALSIAREMNDPEQMRSCYGMLSESYERAGNAKKSIYFFNLYREFNELIESKKTEKLKKGAEQERLKRKLVQRENKLKELEILQKSYELKKKEEKLERSESEKEALLSTLSEKELRLKYIENQNELQRNEQERKDLKNKLLFRNIILFSVLVLVALIMLLFFYMQKRMSNKILNTKNRAITQKNAEIQAQKSQIEGLLSEVQEANESITGSIRYAGLIQKSLMQRELKGTELLPYFFKFHRPKEAVSGDFYWYGRCGDKVVIAAIDCTGHGVPGALLTVLANNILDSIIKQDKITDPGQILEELHLRVKAALSQKRGFNKDGMDIALCTVVPGEKKLYFAGANNPLLILQKREVDIIKGEKYGIAGYSDVFFSKMKEKHPDKKMYQTHSVNIEPGMEFYIFSDGYQDQLGGSKNKKLTSRGFYEVLKTNYLTSFDDKERQLESFYQQWKGEREQVDDVLVLGFKVI
ncbi:MAG: hypothetical protein CSB06_02910 [Bacteroidia bacterium]|nr:MAG: hypothetical protein CSB06_02910 [Bacteroidia bacterium]